MRKSIVALTGLFLVATAIPGSAFMGLTETELLDPIPVPGLFGSDAGCDLRLNGGGSGLAFAGTPMLEGCDSFDMDEVIHDWDISHAAVSCPADSAFDCWSYAFPWSFTGPYAYLYISCVPGAGGVYEVPSGNLVFGAGGCDVVETGDRSGWNSWYGFIFGSANAPPSFSFADNEDDALVHGLLFTAPLPGPGAVSALSAGCDLRGTGSGFGYAHALAPGGPCFALRIHVWTLTHAAVNCPSDSPFACFTLAVSNSGPFGYIFMDCPPGAGGVYELPAGNLVHGAGGCTTLAVDAPPDQWDDWYGFISGEGTAEPSFAFTQLELLAVLHYDSWQ